MKALFTAIFIALVASMLYVLHKQFPYAFQGKDTWLNALQLIFFLIIVLLGLMRSALGYQTIIKYGIAWSAVFLVALIGYSYQWQLKQVFYKVAGQLVPSMGQVNPDHSVTFSGSPNGHFMINAQVQANPQAGSKTIHFLLDTGASKVSLSAADAASLGIDLNRLTYNIRINTANGVNMVAYVTLNYIQVGDIVVRNIGAYVARDGLNGSLLGMNFLGQLGSYDFGDGSVTFRPAS